VERHPGTSGVDRLYRIGTFKSCLRVRHSIVKTRTPSRADLELARKRLKETVPR
jgi:hypothetical protein